MILVFVISLLSGFVITTTGFGYAIVMMAIMPMFFGVPVSNALTIVGAMPALMLFNKIDSEKFKKMIYIFMCFSGLYFIIRGL